MTQAGSAGSAVADDDTEATLKNTLIETAVTTQLQKGEKKLKLKQRSVYKIEQQPPTLHVFISDNMRI